MHVRGGTQCRTDSSRRESADRLVKKQTVQERTRARRTSRWSQATLPPLPYLLSGGVVSAAFSRTQDTHSVVDCVEKWDEGGDIDLRTCRTLEGNGDKFHQSLWDWHEPPDDPARREDSCSGRQTSNIPSARRHRSSSMTSMRPAPSGWRKTGARERRGETALHV